MTNPETRMFLRANILIAEAQGGLDAAACLKSSGMAVSVARTDLGDVLYLANRYDFDCIAFDSGVDAAVAGRLGAVIKAIKPLALVVLLSAGPAARPVQGADEALAHIDANLALPEQCHVLAELIRRTASPVQRYFA